MVVIIVSVVKVVRKNLVLMTSAWQALVSGFKWLSWKSFILGLVERYEHCETGGRHD